MMSMRKPVDIYSEDGQGFGRKNKLFSRLSKLRYQKRLKLNPAPSVVDMYSTHYNLVPYSFLL